MSLVVFVLGCIGALLLARSLSRPIGTVVDGMRAISQGRREALLPLKRRDELGWMIDELNLMAHQLGQTEMIKRQFTASVTHELRSPLTAIDRFVSLLLKETYGGLTPRQKEVLVILQNNSKRLGGFVDDVLAVSQIESGQLKVYQENFDVRVVIEEAVQFLQPLADEKALKIVVSKQHQAVAVSADRSKVSQILINLLSNAIKFTALGQIALDIGFDNQWVQVLCGDTGTGISEKDRPRLFEAYAQGHNAPGTRGTGLGLFISRQFARSMGGDLIYQPNSAGGSSFTLTLPAAY
jgi:signal transduction histidine kinase